MQRNISVFHSIQTNGICLDEEWASFFKANSFLVGLSLDGTQENHDLYRLDAAGQGTWDKVTHALALLDAYRVETNLLCVVTGQLARKPQQPSKASASWDSTICNSSHVLTHLIRLEGRHIL